METEESATTNAAAAVGSMTPPQSPATDAPREATWSFVQMNMSLLPIARPLPVATVCHRFQESFQTGKKPRTPNQKLHRHVLQNASNISPRRHELSGGAVRRVSNTGLFGAASPLQLNDQLRIVAPSSSAFMASFSPSSSTLSPMNASASFRERSQSENALPHRHRVNNKRLCEEDGGGSSSGYASDTCDTCDTCDSVMPPLLLARSVSLSAASDTAKAYKGKRIMELLDEERRLHPDERSSAAQAPTKRSRLQ